MWKRDYCSSALSQPGSTLAGQAQATPLTVACNLCLSERITHPMKALYLSSSDHCCQILTCRYVQSAACRRAHFCFQYTSFYCTVFLQREWLLAYAVCKRQVAEQPDAFWQAALSVPACCSQAASSLPGGPSSSALLQGDIRHDGDDEAGAGQDLNQGVNRLMAAMRDMLANIQFQEPPRDDNPEGDGDWD